MARTTKTQLREGSSIPSSHVKAALEELLVEVGAPGPFSPEVTAEAEAVAKAPDLPELDRTDLPFVTLDPAGSMDLDQAMCLQRAGDGYLVRYAIADVGAFVRPGSLLDQEARRRGQTLYAPHRRVPLHPAQLSEAGASLLPGQVRPAMLWQIGVGADGVAEHVHLERALVRSRGRYDYVALQEAVDAGDPPEPFALLEPLGRALGQAEEGRGGASLRIPDQEIEATETHYTLRYRPVLPVEDWNAQISLMTGMAAAQIMLDAGVGILRTLPPAEQASVDRLRRVAKGLRIRWPGSVDYPEFVRSLDPTDPRHAAMLNASTLLFRGAGYAAFDGERPEQPLHGAMRAPYAHCTAPLRRLVDRYVSQICLSVCAGEEIPGWVREELFSLPDVMADALRRANAYERGIVGLVEALVLSGREGEEFAATVISIDERRGGAEIQIEEPAVQARLTGEAELGSEITAELVEVDLAAGRVEFRAR